MVCLFDRSVWWMSLGLLVLMGVGCKSLEGSAAPQASRERASGEDAVVERQSERHAMVTGQIMVRGVEDPVVLDAMRRVPRHRFVPADRRDMAYEDHPLSIGHSQTISQPYIVGYMTAALSLSSDARVLEIGTGSGYQAAVLAEVAGQVYTIEIVPPLAERARATLEALGYTNIHYRVGDQQVC